MVINITDQVVDICREVTGRAYRAWPQTASKTPYAVISPIGRTVELYDNDGTEVIVRLTYTIGVMADTPSQAESVALSIGEALARYNLHTTGYSDTYEEPNHFYRANITVDGAVDKRGNTFA